MKIFNGHDNCWYVYMIHCLKISALIIGSSSTPLLVVYHFEHFHALNGINSTIVHIRVIRINRSVINNSHKK